MSDFDFDPEFAGARDWIQFYRSIGWQVVPAAHPDDGPNWKRPLIKWRDHQNTLVDDQTADAWFRGRTRAQMGIVTGACSGDLFVIDLDTYKTPAAGEWWQSVLTDGDVLTLETPMQRTGGGGTQIFFHAPPGWVPPTNKTTIGVDVRGRGGFVVIAPSQHDSGREYAWISGMEPWAIPVMVAPDWLCRAVDAVVREHGGDSHAGPTERVPGPANPGGGIVRHALTEEVVDGRETYMTRLIWATLVDAYRDSPIMSDELAMRLMKDAFDVYARKTKSRIRERDTPNHILLEREGRGITLFQQKWRVAYRKWGGEIADAAAETPAPKTSHDKLANLAPASLSAARFLDDDGEEDWDEVSEKPPFKSENGTVPTLVWDRDLTAIAPRRWVYGRETILKFVSLLGSPGGVGKTTLAMIKALSVALGRSLLDRDDDVHHQIHTPGPVWIFNAEDPADEMLRRFVAILRHYNLRRQDFPHAVYMDSGRDQPIVIAHRQDGSLIASPIVDDLIEALTSRGIKLLVVDPFAQTHEGDENKNAEMIEVMRLWSLVADRADCAILLVHHFRKGGLAGDGEAFRGASALQGAARVMHTLSAMSDDEAAKLGVPPEERRSYVRMDSAKSSMAPPATVADWYRLVSVSLDNSADGYPADWVQVVEGWDPPQTFDGLTNEAIVTILEGIEAGHKIDGEPERYILRYRSDSRKWAGEVILKYLDPKGEGRNKFLPQAKAVLKAWTSSGLIYEEIGQGSDRHSRQYVHVDLEKLLGMRNQG